MKELSAAEITREALLILQARNCKAWRQTNLTVRNRKGIVTKGVSDILGYNKGTGNVLAVEVKKIGDKLSNEQIIFLEELRIAGGIALIACQRGADVQLIDFREFKQNDKY